MHHSTKKRTSWHMLARTRMHVCSSSRYGLGSSMLGCARGVPTKGPPDGACSGPALALLSRPWPRPCAAGGSLPPAGPARLPADRSARWLAACCPELGWPGTAPPASASVGSDGGGGKLRGSCDGGGGGCGAEEVRALEGALPLCTQPL